MIPILSIRTWSFWDGITTIVALFVRIPGYGMGMGKYSSILLIDSYDKCEPHLYEPSSRATRLHYLYTYQN